MTVIDRTSLNLKLQVTNKGMYDADSITVTARLDDDFLDAITESSPSFNIDLIPARSTYPLNILLNDISP